MINEIVEYEGKIPRKPIQQLRKLKRQFKAAIGDELLSEIIKTDLLVITEVEQYIIAHNRGDTVGAKRHQNESERLWEETDELIYQVIDEVNANGN
ncbi:hypothetical protein [Bacillus sp. JJ722]|uniref:hypothetical protein n=1 Tax=Bacillus sp. JJ722 TaxID=3122973 RepID=UPI0030009D12